MQKPTDCPLSTDGTFDYDLAERLVRQLQESPLHVFAAGFMSALPDALKTGTPTDELTSIYFPVAMVTDGTRGFLVLVDEVPEYDAALEMTDLLSHVVPHGGHTFVVRAANMRDLDPCVRERTLRLEKSRRVRPEVERAYEDAFPGHAPIDHAAFLASFAPYDACLRDERAIRLELRELEPAARL